MNEKLVKRISKYIRKAAVIEKLIFQSTDSFYE